MFIRGTSDGDLMVSLTVSRLARRPDHEAAAGQAFHLNMPFHLGMNGLAGAVPLLSSKSNVAAAAGIFASEAYQAGLARTIIFDSVNNPYQIANGNSQALSLVSGVSLLNGSQCNSSVL